MTSQSDNSVSRRQFLSFAMIASLSAATRMASAESTLALPQGAFQADLTRNIDAVINGIMKDYKIPGLLLGIIKDNKTIIRKGYGYSDLKRKIKARPEDLYHGGSDGKMFTAVAIALLEQDKRLRVTDPIKRYLPGAPAKWNAITIDMLLRHRSGLVDYNAFLDLSAEWTDAAAVAEFAKPSLEFIPGSQFSYSNTNFALLGFIISSITGGDYANFLKNRVFQPAGMKRARVNDSSSTIPGRAKGYEPDVDRFLKDGTIVVNPVPDDISRSVNRFGDGSILFSVDDFFAWQNAVSRELVLPRAVQKQLASSNPFADGSVSITNYGAGLYTQFIRGNRLVAHYGAWAGFSSWFGTFPEKNLSIVILSNQEKWDFNPVLSKLAGLLDKQLGSYLPVKDTRKRHTAKDKALFRNYLAKGKTPQASAQQRRYASEIFLDTTQAFDFRPYRDMPSGRIYLASSGEGIRNVSNLVTVFNSGKIVIESSW